MTLSSPPSSPMETFLNALSFARSNQYQPLINFIQDNIQSQANTKERNNFLDLIKNGLDTIQRQIQVSDHFLEILKTILNDDQQTKSFLSYLIDSFPQNGFFPISQDSIQTQSIRDFGLNSKIDSKKIAPFSDFDPSSILSILSFICSICYHMISIESNIAFESLFKCIKLLHDNILRLGYWPSLQRDVCECCLLWYEQDRNGREFLTPQTICWLIYQSLESKRKSGRIKRLYSCREMLTFVDFEDVQSSKHLRILLERTIIHPFFLDTNEGKRFLIFLISKLSPTLVPIMHQVIKNELISAPKSKIKIYSEIYYQSWKQASTNNAINLIAIENAIQDLIHHAVHGSNPIILRALNIILEYIINQKINNRDIESMLQRLYTPILWRSFQVANPVVRQNAISQLSIAFPLVSSQDSLQDFYSVLQEQFKYLAETLVDPYPSVRRQAVLASGRILSLYWELIDPRATETLIHHLICNAAFDFASPSIRRASFKALEAILQNHRSNLTLKNCLPKLGLLINDPNPSVRLAFAQLLDAISRNPIIKFYHIVPIKDIINRLTIEPNSSTRTKLSTVLSSTYWPWENHAISQLILRCLTLIQTQHPKSSIAFYASLDIDPIRTKMPISIPVGFISQLAEKILKKWLEKQSVFIDHNGLELEEFEHLEQTEYLENDNNHEIKDGDELEGKNMDRDELNLSLVTPDGKRLKRSDHSLQIRSFNKESILTIVSIIGTLWDSISAYLYSDEKKNSKWISQLAKIFDPSFLIDLAHALNSANVFTELASHLDAEEIPEVVERLNQCLWKKDGIKSIDGSIQSIIECIFSWSTVQGGHLIQKIEQHLSSALIGSLGEEESNGVKQSVRIQIDFKRSLEILDQILDHSDWIRASALTLPETQSLLFVLVRYHELAERILEDDSMLTIDSGDDIKINPISSFKSSHQPIYIYPIDISHTLSIYYKLVVHLSGINHMQKQGPPFEDMLDWIDEKILSRWINQAGEKVQLEKHDATSTLSPPISHSYHPEIIPFRSTLSNQFSYHLLISFLVILTDLVTLNMAEKRLLPRIVHLSQILLQSPISISLSKKNDSLLQIHIMCFWKLVSYIQEHKIKIISELELENLIRLAIRQDPSPWKKKSILAMRSLLLSICPIYQDQNSYSIDWRLSNGENRGELARYELEEAMKPCDLSKILFKILLDDLMSQWLQNGLDEEWHPSDQPLNLQSEFDAIIMTMASHSVALDQLFKNIITHIKSMDKSQMGKIDNQDGQSTYFHRILIILHIISLIINHPRRISNKAQGWQGIKLILEKIGKIHQPNGSKMDHYRCLDLCHARANQLLKSTILNPK